MNVVLIGLFAANLRLRLRLRRRRRRPATPSRSGPLPTLLSVLGSAGLLVSAWYGAHLVYDHGVHVKGRSPLSEVAELAPPGDSALVEALEAPSAVANPCSGSPPHLIHRHLVDRASRSAEASASRAGQVMVTRTLVPEYANTMRY